MSETKRCPQCQTEIPATAPEGLCPQCLLQAGLESKTAPQEPQQTAAYTPSGPGFVPPTPAELQSAFPQLEILELLGKGGMGAVYKARQRGLDRLVAVKILPPEYSQDPAFAERFLREAKALAMLSHPNIVGVHDVGQTAPSPPAPLPQGARGGYCYFVMEYVDGVNLRQAMRAGTLKPAEALKIVPQICDALQFAHDEGIVHRDIKPENILLDKKGRVKIADFGLAKLLGKTPHDISLTGTQQVMGTMHYMAPEQIEGARDVDHRADIYSLGVTFYEMLTGELPIGRFAAPSKKVQIDVRLDEVVLRSLEKAPEQRYQHASEIKTDMETIASGPVAAAAGASTAKLDTPISVPYAGVVPTGPFDLGAFGMLHFDGVFLEFEITKRGFFSNSRLQSVRIPLAEVKSMLVEKGEFFSSLCLRTNRMRALDGLPFGSQGQVELTLEPENVAAAQELQKAVSRALQRHQKNASEIKTEEEGIVQAPAAPFAAAGADADARLGLTCATVFFLVLSVISMVFFAVNWGKDDAKGGLICGGVSLFGLAVTIFGIVRHRRRNTARHGTEQPQPPPPPRRPWGVPILGAINIFVGLVFLFVCAVGLVNPEPVPAAIAADDTLRPLCQVWRIAQPISEYVAAMLWFAGGIGLLLWKPWARRVTVATAVFLIAWFVLSIPVVIAFDIQPALAEIPWDANADPWQMAMTGAFFVIGVSVVILPGLIYEIAVIAYLSRPRVIAAFNQQNEQPPVDPHESKALPSNAANPAAPSSAARLLSCLRSIILPLVVACGVYIAVFAGVAKAIGEDVAIGTAIGATVLTLAAFWVYRKYGFAFMRPCLPYAWTALCVVLFVMLWTSYEANRGTWSGYLDGTIWPHRGTTESKVSLEPPGFLYRRLIIREELEADVRGHWEGEVRVNPTGGKQLLIKHIYTLEIDPINPTGDGRLHLIVDARNGMSWRVTDGSKGYHMSQSSGTLVDAVVVAEWIRLASSGPGILEDELIERQAQAIVGVLRRATSEQISGFLRPEQSHPPVIRLDSAVSVQMGTIPADRPIPFRDWNAAGTTKWAPVVPILYVGVPLMLAVWGVGLWVFLRKKHIASDSAGKIASADGATQDADAPPHADDPLEQLVIDQWYPGRKIAAIVAYREKTGADLAEAKAAVEKIADKFRLPGRHANWKVVNVLIMIGFGLLLALIALSPVVSEALIAAAFLATLLTVGICGAATVFAFAAVWEEWWKSPSPLYWKIIRTGFLLVGLIGLWSFVSFSMRTSNAGAVFQIGTPSPWLSFSTVPGGHFHIEVVSGATAMFALGWLAFWAYRQSFAAAPDGPQSYGVWLRQFLPLTLVLSGCLAIMSYVVPASQARKLQTSLLGKWELIESAQPQELLWEFRADGTLKSQSFKTVHGKATDQGGNVVAYKVIDGEHVLLDSGGQDVRIRVVVLGDELTAEQRLTGITRFKRAAK